MNYAKKKTTNVEGRGVMPMRTWYRNYIGSSAAVAALALSGPAYAQTGAPAAIPPAPASPSASGSGVQDIIVTANRRNERLQDVPIAISAVTAQTLASSGIQSTAEIAQVVPGLTFQSSMNGVQAHLRGVGTTAVPAGTENSIATYIDGVYILSMSGALLQLNSIDQIEVLKGPQGTLFGRNATGGVINVRTRDPKHDPGGEFSLQYGNYDTFTGHGYLTTGITPTLAADIAAYVSRQGDGWGKNIATGNDAYKGNDFAMRSKWLWTPGDRDEFRLAGDYSYSTGNLLNSFRMTDGSTAQYGPGSTVAGARPDLAPYLGPSLAPFAIVGDPYLFNAKPYDIAMSSDPHGNFKNWGVSLQWDHEFDGFRTQTITAYRKANRHQVWNATPVPADRTIADYEQDEDQFSQEFQIASLASSRVKWVAGLYYLKGTSDYDPFFITGTALSPVQRLLFNADTATKSGAAFGQATIPLGESTNVTVGGRYNIERRSLKGETVIDFLPGFGLPPEITQDPTDAHKTFRKFTWRLSLDHKFAPNLLGYASFNRGFKSGIYNTIPPGGPDAQPVKPEILDAYEVGVKSELFDRKLRLNVSGFLYKYKDLQVTVFTPVSALIANGAKAQIYGADVDLMFRPTRALSITGGFTWMHSEFKSYPNAQFLVPQPISAGGGNTPFAGSAAGNELPYAPKFTGNIGLNYEIPLESGKIDAGFNYSYNSGWFAGPDNILRQKAYSLANGQVTWQIGNSGLSAGLWGKNIFKQKYYVFLSAGNNPGGYNQGIRGAPRTYGVSLGYKF